MVFVKAHALEGIIKDAEQCAAKCWWEAHDKKNYVKAGDLFAEQEEIIAKYAGNKPAKPRDIADCFALTLQKYDNFTDILKTGDGELGDLEGQLREMLFGVYKTLNVNVEAARHNIEWWVSFARMRLAQKQMATVRNEFKKDDAEYQHNKYGAIMFQHMAAEHKARYDFDEDTAKGLASLELSAAFLGHNKRDYVKAKQLLKMYYMELFSNLAKKD